MNKDSNNYSVDILGIKPIGDAANSVVNKSLGGIEGFLKAVCVPALEEFGLLLKDKVRHWRFNNISKILDKAQGKLCFENESLQFKAHPRVALAIIENGSLNDHDELQEMWAGLFASSCTVEETDDENLIFIDLLKQLTVCEARILRYACENTRKIIYENGLIVGSKLKIELNILMEITGVKEVHRLDRELDHLRSLELIARGSIFGNVGGFDASDPQLSANITPTALALSLYTRIQGHNSDPIHYWKQNIITIQDYMLEQEKNNIEKQ